MKDGKIRLGDVFEELNMAPDSPYRFGIITEIKHVESEDDNVCRVQSTPTKWCWIYAKGLRKLPAYVYKGHVDLDRLFADTLAPFKGAVDAAEGGKEEDA